ncbi:DUF2946 domain-containing protein [Burkholderia catarinensis]|uniref:DUF2946 domain-containing protein n=1 Tax=Burkholderia catarinensis TaxID=1108140 RepID=UPI0035589E53|nr:hypothetical protein BFF94_027040 [Burkholderia catarinensis]
MPLIMTARSRIRTTAWLGIFAIWLVVIAPIVSHGLVSHDRNAPVASICSADGQPDVNNAPAADHFAACGYCDLLAHHTPAPSPSLSQWLEVPSSAVAVPPASLPFVFRDISRAGRPRDSPFYL